MDNHILSTSRENIRGESFDGSIAETVRAPGPISNLKPLQRIEQKKGFCYQQGAIWGGFTGPVLTLFAATQPLGFAVPMLISTVGAAVVFVVALLLGPETKGKVLVSQLSLAA
jgi:hypothetical protein